MDVASMETILETLFPTHPTREDRSIEDVEEFPLFKEEELRRAVQSLTNKKAPGSDGITAEVLKITAEHVQCVPNGRSVQLPMEGRKTRAHQQRERRR